MSLDTTFQGQISQVSTKLTVDLARVTTVQLKTDDQIAGKLQSFPPDKLVRVTIKLEE
jgi:hypothetical protein